MKLAAERQKPSPTELILAAPSVILTGALGGFLGDALSKSFLEDAHPGVGAIVAIFFVVIGASITGYYWIVFGYGSSPAKSRERVRYNRLRTELRRGGRIGLLYERMLEGGLTAVDRFLGDQDQADRTLFPRAFGLRKASPLWTLQSFDRCLLIALVYPVAMIFVIWAASGHVGPAERALRLPSGVNALQRGIGLAGIIVIGLAWFPLKPPNNWRVATRQVLTFVAGLLVARSAFGGFSAVIAGVAVAMAFLFLSASRRAPPSAGTIALTFALSCAAIVSFPETRGASVLLAYAILAASFGLIGWGVPRRSFSWRLILCILAVYLVALIGPLWIGRYVSGESSQVLLLFLVVLTLANAPFDWITIGLTRALLRRGLELGGWWPLIFGLIDLFAAVAVVAGLSVATLWSAQIFAHFTLLGGGRPSLEVQQLLLAMADRDRRYAPEYWWLYAMLFSTLIPSIVNVAFGALSLMRGIPGLHSGLARRMPSGSAVLASERMWMAPMLAIQAMLGTIIGLIVMFGLIWIIFGWILPLVGLNLLAMLQALAAADLPGRLLGALGIG